MSTILYGASDDLIELEGDISEEFGARYRAEPPGDLVAFSTGTVLRIAYTSVWRITHVAGPVVPIEQCSEDDDDHYSDRATIEGATWAVLGTDWAKADA